MRSGKQDQREEKIVSCRTAIPSHIGVQHTQKQIVLYNQLTLSNELKCLNKIVMQIICCRLRKNLALQNFSAMKHVLHLIAILLSLFVLSKII